MISRFSDLHSDLCKCPSKSLMAPNSSLARHDRATVTTQSAWCLTELSEGDFAISFVLPIVNNDLAPERRKIVARSAE